MARTAASVIKARAAQHQAGIVAAKQASGKAPAKVFPWPILTGTRAVYSTPAEMAEGIARYFSLCVEFDDPPTIPGLAMWLGFDSSESIRNYKTLDGYSGLIKEARLFIEQEYNRLMVKRNTTPVGLIFLLKNHFGYRDIPQGEGKEQGLGALPDALAHLVDALADKIKSPAAIDITPSRSVELPGSLGGASSGQTVTHTLPDFEDESR